MRLWRLFCLMLAVMAPACAYERIQGWCSVGAIVVVTSGFNSTNKVQASYPVCTVTVTIVGTGGDATLYSDNTGDSLGNPFTADSQGHWFFYVANGRYNVTISGGGIASPYTFGDITAFDFTQAVYTCSNGNCVARLLTSKLEDIMSVQDFGAVADNVTDNLTAFTNAAAAVNAIAASTGLKVELYFPNGSYLYTGGLVFTRPVELTGYGAVLNYTGTGIAVKLGPDGLSSTSYEGQEDYSIHGITFTGGASMTYGVLVNSWVVQPHMQDVYMLNFGNANAYGFFFMSNNWHIVIDHCKWHTTYGGPDARNWIRVNGINSAGVSDVGASYIEINHSLGSQYNSNGGVGVYIGGAYSLITDSVIAGFSPNVQVGGYAYNTRITNTYLEATKVGGGPCIAFGDSSGSPFVLFFTEGLTLDKVACDVHQVDLATGNVFLGPTTVNSGLMNATITTSRMLGWSGSSPMIAMNNVAGQVQNYAARNYTTGLDYPTMTRVAEGLLHTAGTLITPWIGSDETNVWDRPTQFYDPTATIGDTQVYIWPGVATLCQPYFWISPTAFSARLSGLNTFQVTLPGCPNAPTAMGGVDSNTSGIVSSEFGKAAAGAFHWMTDGVNFNWGFGSSLALNNDFSFFTDRFPGTAGTRVMAIGKGNGRVRIGSPVPSDDGVSQLQVAGPVTFTLNGPYTTNAAASAAGVPVGGLYYCGATDPRPVCVRY